MQKSKLNFFKTVLAVLLLTFSIFSVAVIALKNNHECSEDNCPICFVINVAEQNLKLLSLTGLSVAVLRHFNVFRAPFFNSQKITYLKSNTLIAQKVRLND